MLSKKMEEALNQQINAEAYSAYLYLAMSAHFQAHNLLGFAHWMRVQFKEETEHAMKIYDYVLDRGGKVTLRQIETPPASWASPLKAIEDTYKHEQSITAKIGKLADLANEERDHATGVFLQWFVSEQVEEESQTNLILEQLKLVGESAGGLLVLDHHLEKRE